jgi:hypothetical protein
MFFDNHMLFCSCPIVGFVPFANRSDDGRESAQAGLICSSGFEWTKNLTGLLPPRIEQTPERLYLRVENFVVEAVGTRDRATQFSPIYNGRP